MHSLYFLQIVYIVMMQFTAEKSVKVVLVDGLSKEMSPVVIATLKCSSAKILGQTYFDVAVDIWQYFPLLHWIQMYYDL